METNGLGQTIQALREAHELERWELALRSGACKATVYNTERGLSRPQDQTVRQIARAFNVRISDLDPARGCWEDRGAESRPSVSEVIRRALAERREQEDATIRGFLRNQGVEV